MFADLIIMVLDRPDVTLWEYGDMEIQLLTIAIFNKALV